MIFRTIAGTALTLAVLGFLTQPSMAGSFPDIGANCFVQDRQANEDVSGPRLCKAAAAAALTQISSVCGGQSLRTISGPAYLAARMRVRAAHQNICARTSALLPVSYHLSSLPE